MVTPRRLWAYTYQLDPPQSVESLKQVETLLADERTTAAQHDGKWEARLVVDDRVSHILVLSDSPDLDREIHRRLERALREIHAHFALTVPMAVTPEPNGGVAQKD